jgi:hypothetical protein
MEIIRHRSKRQRGKSKRLADPRPASFVRFWGDAVVPTAADESLRAAGTGRLGELADGRFMALQFAKPEFDRMAASEGGRVTAPGPTSALRSPINRGAPRRFSVGPGSASSSRLSQLAYRHSSGGLPEVRDVQRVEQWLARGRSATYL